MSSSMRASGSSTLYWSCAKYSATTLWPSLIVARGGRFVAGEQLDERRLARAVDADQRHAVATLDGEARFGKDALRAVILSQVLCLDNRAARGRRLGKLEVDDWLFFGNLDALDFFQLLDARLHLLGLGGLGAEAIDEGLKMLDALAADCGRRLRAARGARLSALNIWCNCPDRW